MKRLLIVLVIMSGFASLGWGKPPGGPPVPKVEVINEYLNVDIQNQPLNVNVLSQPQPLDVNVMNQSVDTNVMNWPDMLDVRVVNQPQPIYEYYVFERLNVTDFQIKLDEKAAEGFELNFFTGDVATGVYTTQHYIGIMRKPVQPVQ